MFELFMLEGGTMIEVSRWLRYLGIRFISLRIKIPFSTGDHSEGD